MTKIYYAFKKEPGVSSKVLLLLIILSMIGCGGGGGSHSSDHNGGLPSNSVILTWEAPTSRVDGTPLIDLAGYYVYYGDFSRNYTTRIDVGKVLTFRMDDLRPGLYFFAVTAYDSSGNQSLFSNEVSKGIPETQQ